MCRELYVPQIHIINSNRFTLKQNHVQNRLSSAQQKCLRNIYTCTKYVYANPSLCNVIVHM
jgi:hypothetical protein